MERQYSSFKKRPPFPFRDFPSILSPIHFRISEFHFLFRFASNFSSHFSVTFASVKGKSRGTTFSSSPLSYLSDLLWAFFDNESPSLWSATPTTTLTTETTTDPYHNNNNPLPQQQSLSRHHPGPQPPSILDTFYPSPWTPEPFEPMTIADRHQSLGETSRLSRVSL